MSRLIMGLEEGAFQLGYELLLAHSLNQAGREEECIRRFLARRVDGIFIAPVYRLALRAPIYQELRERQIRTVILGQPAPFCPDFCHVTPDDVAGAQRVTQHLIELGHRQIACLAGHPSSPAAQERYEGYQRALREAGLPVNEQLMFSSGATIEDGEKAALQMINENCPATAVVAVNDLVAIGAADVFLRQGRRIPGDISIAGFGNTLLAEHYRVPLTTVRQPKLRLGTAAIETMRRLIAGERPENRRLPAELEIRASTAPPGRPE
jgi:LacI family transcriptional regulator